MMKKLIILIIISAIPTISFATGLNYDLVITNYTPYTVEVEAIKGDCMDGVSNDSVQVLTNQTSTIGLYTNSDIPCGGDNSSASYQPFSISVVNNSTHDTYAEGQIEMHMSSTDTAGTYHCVNYFVNVWNNILSPVMLITPTQEANDGYYDKTINVNVCVSGDTRCNNKALTGSTC